MQYWFFTLSLNLKVKTIKIIAKKKSHNLVCFSNHYYHRKAPIKTAEHLPSLASQKPNSKCGKNKFSLRLPNIPKTYSDIKTIIATLSAYSKRTSDKGYNSNIKC